MEHEEQADRLEHEAEKMEEESERVGEQIEETRGDWEAKEQDASVPGAQPELDDEHRQEDGADEADADAADEEED